MMEFVNGKDDYIMENKSHVWNRQPVHWIGLRENPQDTMVFTMKKQVGSCKFSRKPICRILLDSQIPLEIFSGWLKPDCFRCFGYP